MMSSRLPAALLPAALLAAGLLVPPAMADEYAAYEQVDVAAPGAPGCHAGMLLSLPSSWRATDGAAVVLTLGPHDHAAREVLVSALLEQRAAVLELVPLRCGAAGGGGADAVASALGALDALKRQVGAGLVVAIGYGAGAAAVLEVVDDRTANRLGADGPRYAAAVAMGEGAPAFVRGAVLPPREQAPERLAILCQALADIAGGTGSAAPDHGRVTMEADACRTAMAEQAPAAGASAPRLVPVGLRQ